MTCFILAQRAITDGSKTRLFTIPGFEKDWDIPLLYHYSVYNGRYSPSQAHIAPCVIKYDPQADRKNGSLANEEYRDDMVLLSLWKTRCNDPQIHLVLWKPGETNCILFKCKSPAAFFKCHYCDLNARFDEDEAKRYEDAE